MPAESGDHREARGFEGAVFDLSLSDVIQLEGHNRFSGAISVLFEERRGQLYFQKGEIVHAEQGVLSGEDAAYEILQWPGGSFTLQPNVTTIGRTIRTPIGYLLLEAHRRMDEARRPSPAPPPSEPSRGRPMNAFARGLQGIPGVAYVVLAGPGGTPVDDPSPAAEALAARGFFLASLVGDPIGELFGLGALNVAAVRGTPDQLLVFRSKDRHLCLTLAPDASPEAVETEVRKALAPPRSGG